MSISENHELRKVSSGKLSYSWFPALPLRRDLNQADCPELPIADRILRPEARNFDHVGVRLSPALQSHGLQALTIEPVGCSIAAEPQPKSSVPHDAMLWPWFPQPPGGSPAPCMRAYFRRGRHQHDLAGALEKLPSFLPKA